MKYATFLCILAATLALQVSAKPQKPHPTPELNRPYAVLKSLPIGSVMPGGWIEQFLVNQRNGLTGYLEMGGFPFNTNLWMPPFANAYENDPWWRYEQTGYWIDGMIRCGYLLNDSTLINRALRQINYIVSHPDNTGYLGPVFNKEEGKMLRWPHAVFFRAVMAAYEKTHDKKIMDALTKHYLGERYAHSDFREITNIETILYCYDKTRDTALLHFGEKLFSEWIEKDKGESSFATFMQDTPIREHGVTYNEKAKLGAIMYMYTGNKKFLENSISAYEKVQKYHMLADGMHSCTEYFRDVSALEGHEGCDVSDFTWSLSYMVMATGKTHYADMIEKVIFNALPGQVLNDFKALQYFSCPNQVLATSESNHSKYYTGNTTMRYAPNPWNEVQCCPANINRAMPNYISNQWMTDANQNLYAVLYGPSVVTYTTKDGNAVRITQEGNYPFEESVRFRVQMARKAALKISFRVPAWSGPVKVLLNNQPIALTPQNGFIAMDRKWSTNDTVELVFSPEIKLVTWANNGVSIERGPLVYAMPVKMEKRIHTADSCSTTYLPAYEIYPASAWNYGVDMNHLKTADIQVNRSVVSYPFKDSGSPITLTVPAYKIPNWGLATVPKMKTDESGTKQFEKNVTVTPDLPGRNYLDSLTYSKAETIELVPYGITKLRLTILPTIYTK